LLVALVGSEVLPAESAQLVAADAGEEDAAAAPGSGGVEGVECLVVARSLEQRSRTTMRSLSSARNTSSSSAEWRNGRT
jgi:hypothetical protein